MIALTFDDGPGPSTLSILDVLRRHGILATFFVLGRNVAEPPWTTLPEGGRDIVRDVLRDGHIVGNHTYSHARSSEISEPALRREINVTDDIINHLRAELGFAPIVPPLRLPFGIIQDDTRLVVIGAMGRTHVHWSCNFRDWREGPQPALVPRILEYVTERENAGLDSVLDLHDGGIGGVAGFARDATVDAAERLALEASRRGWRFFQAPLAHH